MAISERNGTLKKAKKASLSDPAVLYWPVFPWRVESMEGEFETHITLAPDERQEPLQQWAGEHRMKYVHIVLDRGLSPSQPMLTCHGKGTFASQLKRAQELAAELQNAGFKVTRLKLEAAPDNNGVPQTEAEAHLSSPSQYFEHHVKLLLPSELDLIALIALAENHGAHLSRNAFRIRKDGLEERFVTQRCYRVGRNAAARQLESLVNRLKSDTYQILEAEEEYVVHDDNLALDAGWLKERGPE